jgi:cbb3-type cytochrome oxidase subunit 3
MNPIFQEAAQTARLGWIMGVLTILFLACFLGWTWWAYAPSHRQRMDEAARMPLTDGGEQ